jgi:putative (di)nucleoside polyphosphate hydrolase
LGNRSDDAIEALVEQLLDDPLTALVMTADHIDRAGAAALFRAVAFSLPNAGPEPHDSSAGDLIMSESEAPDFRRGVGIVLFNRAGKVFLAERIDVPGAWQMPQGGIDEGETPKGAALRELREEIGTDRVEILAESKAWLRYELPADLPNQPRHPGWRGQQQKWFAMMFVGEDEDIDLATDHPEFSAWQWATFEKAVSLITSFKRPVYERLAQEFAALGGRAAS